MRNDHSRVGEMRALQRAVAPAEGRVVCRSCGMTDDEDYAENYWWWINPSREWECPDCEQEREEYADWRRGEWAR